MAICNNKKCSLSECDQPETCTAYVPVITNADRIRTMSDEDLAEWLTEFANEAFADGAIRFGGALMTEHDRLTWLQQPVKEEQ